MRSSKNENNDFETSCICLQIHKEPNKVHIQSDYMCAMRTKTAYTFVVHISSANE